MSKKIQGGLKPDQQTGSVGHSSDQQSQDDSGKDLSPKLNSSNTNIGSSGSADQSGSASTGFTDQQTQALQIMMAAAMARVNTDKVSIIQVVVIRRVK